MRFNNAFFAVLAFPLVVACGPAPESTDSTTSSSVTAAAATQPANFLEVTEGIYRGGHPDTAGIAYLKGMGVRTIVDLEVDDLIEAWPWEIAQEERDAKAADLTLLRYPMSAFEPAVSDDFDQKIANIMANLADDSLKPIYVHCKHGQDRTGLVIGLERVLNEGWDPQPAHDEMVKIGFHTGFLGLEDYYKRKTGWSDDTNGN